MSPGRPIALSIAGLDPCAGAGLFADIKTFEQHKVYGLGISTAQTIQTENIFYSIKWEKEEDILYAVKQMLAQYKVNAIKIGIVKNLFVLNKVVSCVYETNKEIKIVYDPVIKSSTDYNFFTQTIDEQLLVSTLAKIFLITPNYSEALQLLPSANAKEATQKLRIHCNVLLKGGHNPEEPGVDYLFTKNAVEKLIPKENNLIAKHGSGCVLSAAIASNLAYGYDLETSCRNAKNYVEQFLKSTTTLLGHHHV